MKFELLYASTLAASFELLNDEVYYAPSEYDVLLNGKVVLTKVKTNVFTIYDLEPDTEYFVTVDGYNLTFRTRKASLISHISEFKNLGNNDDTLMFQAAIAALPKDGILYVDKGVYHITSIFLKSDMTLYLEEGAHLIGNPEMNAYAVIPPEQKYIDANKKELQLGTWEGNPREAYTSFVNGIHICNVDIIGKGEIDGNAQNSLFWKNVKTQPIGRPRDIYLNDCEHINFIGVTIENTAAWTIHPYFSNHLGFYDIKVSNPKDAPNTDGMDPECCDDVKIIGTYFSVGDDCIAIKSGKFYIGQKYNVPSSNIVIRNCRMHEGHGAVVIGSEIGAGVKDITVEKCLFEHTDRGLRIKTRRGRGRNSIVDGILFRNIIMKHVLTPLVVNMFYFCDPDGHEEYVWSKKKLPVDERTPYIGSFVFENIIAEDAEYALGWFAGLPEMPIESITVRNCNFTVSKGEKIYGNPAMMDGYDKQSKIGFYFLNVNKVRFENVKASGYEGERFIVDNVLSLEEK
ncbi:MAG: glycoside hydrolase family 28 protein [Bacilli bacterium]|nr:glycoside hydrolase family 28 protein [Bacilli bacterium]